MKTLTLIRKLLTYLNHEDRSSKVVRKIYGLQLLLDLVYATPLKKKNILHVNDVAT
jgi:hypothetical protein